MTCFASPEAKRGAGCMDMVGMAGMLVGMVGKGVVVLSGSAGCGDDNAEKGGSEDGTHGGTWFEKRVQL